MEELICKIKNAIFEKQNDAIIKTFRNHPEIKTIEEIIVVKIDSVSYDEDHYIQQNYEIRYNQKVIDNFNIIIDYSAKDIVSVLGIDKSSITIKYNADKIKVSLNLITYCIK